MTCSSCVAKVKSELLKLGDVTSADEDASMHHITSTDAKEASDNSYLPIFLIFGYISGVTLLVQIVQPHFNLMHWMSHFMAGFFLVFSFFKIMDLKGFAEGYSTYDVLAKKIPLYGFVYPFIELGLGIAFLTGFNPLITDLVTLVVMGVSTIGVVQSLIKKTLFNVLALVQ